MIRWNKLIECPYCEGEGQYVEEQFEFGDKYEDCYLCGGRGRLSPFEWLAHWWYEYLDEKAWNIINFLRGGK